MFINCLLYSCILLTWISNILSGSISTLHSLFIHSASLALFSFLIALHLFLNSESSTNSSNYLNLPISITHSSVFKYSLYNSASFGLAPTIHLLVVTPFVLLMNLSGKTSWKSLNRSCLRS